MTDGFLPPIEELYDTAPCGLLLAGPRGHVLSANATLCRWLQYTKEELCSGDVRLQDLLTMGGRIFHQTHLAPLLRMQRSVAEVKLDLKRRDGTEVPMMLNLSERIWRDEPVVHVAAFVAEDRIRYERELLAQRRRAEELAQQHARDQQDLEIAQRRLRLALESAKLFAWEVDPATGERRYEDGAARLLGYSGPLRVDPATFLGAIHPEDRASELAAFEQALRGDETYHCTYRIRGLDRRERVVASWGRAFFDASGKLVQFMGLLQDSTPTV
jgi:sigma-B regulation protein RsbU (phosphoserine phosphatase)